MSHSEEPRAAADAPPASAPPSDPRALGRYLATFGITLVCLCLAAGITNHRLDPLNFSTAHHVHLAETFNKGENFAIYDPSFEFRGLRREHIRRMPDTPDVLIFAGSRFQEATAETLPFTGVTFYNAFVHSDYYEDYLALSELLIQANRLPKTLVLSVRYKSFMPVAERTTDEWRMFAPEYRAMADRLGVEKLGWLESAPIPFWLNVVSLPVVRRNVELSWKHRSARTGPTTEASQEVFDTLRPDGALVFSKQHQATWTLESSRADAIKRAKKASKEKLSVDRGRVLGFTKLLDELKRRGTHVVIAMTPHHPHYWRGIAESPYGRTLAGIEREMYEIGAAHGATVVGSFDADRAGCIEATFLDYIHFTNECLKAVFSGIPAVTR